jgi:hypothetical protein
MRYFDRLATGAPVANLRNQLSRHPELWNADRFRTQYPNGAHEQVDDILIRYSDTSKCGTETVVMGDGFEAIWHPAAAILTEAKPLVLSLLAQVGAYALDRVLITRVAPGNRILRHKDADGGYVQQADIARYHVVLNAAPGCTFTNGPDQEPSEADETVYMATGDVWSFNPHAWHSVTNNSGDDRLHLIVDLRTWP